MRAPTGVRSTSNGSATALRKPPSSSAARAASGISSDCRSLQTSDMPLRRTRPMTLVSSSADSAIVYVCC